MLLTLLEEATVADAEGDVLRPLFLLAFGFKPVLLFFLVRIFFVLIFDKREEAETIGIGTAFCIDVAFVLVVLPPLRLKSTSIIFNPFICPPIGGNGEAKEGI